MSTVFPMRSLRLWWRTTILIFLCYDVLWIPILIEDNSYVASQIVKSLLVDVTVCSLISLVNCLVCHLIKSRFINTESTNKRIIIAVLGIFVFNLALCFPFSVVKWWLYDTIFHDCPWTPGENWLDTYILSSVASIILVSNMLIWVTGVLRQKERTLAEARLKSLKNQINPHFLFNNLNAGIALIDYAPDKAVSFFTSMAKVFRTVLERSMVSTHSLKEELEDLGQYLNLLRIRFGEAINIELRLNDADMHKLILGGTLQLIFENIVKHNRFSVSEPISVIIFAEDDAIFVINDYRPLSENSGSHGVGQPAIIRRYVDFGKTNISFRMEGDKYISQLPLLPTV